MDRIWLITKLLSLPTILIALTVHEYAHGYIAYRLGDPTAKEDGRLTLNPLKHLDPIGALCMLLFGFGWATPVPIDVRYFKNRKRGMSLTALAGPVSNFLLAFFGALLFAVADHFLGNITFTEQNTQYWLAFSGYNFLYMFVRLNVALGLFNMIPLPPLDGSRIFLVWLPERIYFRLMRYERYIALGFMIVLLIDSRLGLGVFNGFLSGISQKISDAFVAFWKLIPFLQ